MMFCLEYGYRWIASNVGNAVTTRLRLDHPLQIRIELHDYLRLRRQRRQTTNAAIGMAIVKTLCVNMTWDR